MTNRKWLLHQLVISCILGAIIGIAQIALADYQPPDDQKPPTDSSDSSGGRI